METEELSLLKYLHDQFSGWCQSAIAELVTPGGEKAQPPFNVENIAYISGQIAALNNVLNVIEQIGNRKKIQFEGAES